MSQVVSFARYRPAPRFDEVPWTQARIEEGPSSSGPWAVIDTIALDPVDGDPSKPQIRNLTTSNGSDGVWWYRVLFVDESGDVAQPTQPILNALTTYVTADDLKATLELRAEDFADDDIHEALQAASEGIDLAMGRSFRPPLGAEERLYSPDDLSELWIDDFAELEKLEIDERGTGTFLEWDLGADVRVEPLNAAGRGRPYTKLRTLGSRSFPMHPLGVVRVTAYFGWPATPAQIVDATKLIATQLLRRKRDAPFGVLAITPELAAHIARFDPNLNFLFHGLERKKVQW